MLSTTTIYSATALPKTREPFFDNDPIRCVIAKADLTGAGKPGDDWDMRIAISMGDPAGIGPEIIARALHAEGITARNISYHVHGSLAVFKAVFDRLRISMPQRGVTWVDIAPERDLSVLPGERSRACGELQWRSLASATDAVLAGQADALVTAPITKSSIALAGFGFPGHTEYLGARSAVAEPVMMLAGPALRVVPLTGHVPLREVPARLKREEIARVAVTTAQALRRDFGIAHPWLALLGLNPHAGEGGLLGDEETRILQPALVAARAVLTQSGLDARIDGPLPADGIFVRRDLPYHALLCCYHDQALIPLKLLCADQAVNVTLGLPFVRTSPAHGSALDIAATGSARPQSMIAALHLAEALTLRRRQRL